ncbi:hypothetical protein [Leclercia sp. GLN_9]|uniref:head-tail joining protein n=1 Tax=Leclercia sp. GLN_9 TaxID=3367184 RepID=UPI00370BD20F
MRAFNSNDMDALINSFGEKLLLKNGSAITVIFEQDEIAIQTTEGLIQTTENYFTCRHDQITYDDTFVLNNVQYEIYNIIDDLSGLCNVYYRGLNA